MGSQERDQIGFDKADETAALDAGLLSISLVIRYVCACMDCVIARSDLRCGPVILQACPRADLSLVLSPHTFYGGRRYVQCSGSGTEYMSYY